MFEYTKIKEKVQISLFLERVKKIKQEKIECTTHAFFRLSKKQKAVYTEGELKRVLIEEAPFLVGIQDNECHAVFYNYKGKILKMIVVFNSTKLNI